MFLSTILFYFLADKRNWTHFAALLLSFFLIVLLIGTKAKERTGYFLYQAVSGGYNLAMSSFDEANGLVNFNGFGDSKNYIYLGPEPYTFIERDSLLKAASIKWITENPKQYLSQFPLKLAALYCEDTWSERVKPDMGFRTVLENMENDKKAFVQLAASLVLKSAVYYVVLFLFLCYLWFNRKSFLSKRNIFLLIPFLGTAVTLIFVITSRYHYPYLFMITIYAASALIELVNNRRNQGSAKFELSYNKTL